MDHEWPVFFFETLRNLTHLGLLLWCIKVLRLQYELDSESFGVVRYIRALYRNPYLSFHKSLYFFYLCLFEFITPCAIMKWFDDPHCEHFHMLIRILRFYIQVSFDVSAEFV